MSDPSTPRRSWLDVLAWIALLVCLAATFGPALRGDILSDDALVLRHGAAASGSDASAGLEAPSRARPLEQSAFALARAIGHGRPLAFHALALTAHLAAATAVFVLAKRTTKRRSIALASALLFGLHPLHAENVARISALHASLGGALVLFALYVFVVMRERDTLRWPLVAASALSFTLALLASESALSFIALAAAFDFASRRSRDPSPTTHMRVAPYAVFSACAVAVFLATREASSASTSLGMSTARLVALRIELVIDALARLAWPWDPSVLRAFRPEQPSGDARFLAGLVALIALSGACVWLHARRRSLALAFALLIPAGLCWPLYAAHTLGPFPFSAEHLVLSAPGFALLLGLVASSRIGFALVCVAALACGVRARERVALWHDDLTLLRAAVALELRSPALQWRLGRALLHEYRARADVSTLAAAGRTFEAALDLLDARQRGDTSVYATSDDFLQANLGLGWTLLFEAERDTFATDDTALRVFQMVAERYPASAEAHTGLGVAALVRGRIDDAQRAFDAALALRPSYAEAWHNLGQLRVRRGDFQGAAEAFEAALRARPDHVDDLLWLARARAESGDRERALAALARASQLAPRAAAPLVIRGTVEAGSGNLEAALTWVQRALELAPDDGGALALHGKILLARGELHGARRVLQRAVVLLPHDFEANYNLAALLLKADEIAEAVPYLVQAYLARPATTNDAELRRTLLDVGLRDADTLWHLASNDMDRGRVDLAEDWLARALERDAEHGPSHLLLGMIRKERGDTDAAIAALERATRAMPKSYVAHFTLGKLLADLDRIDESLVYLEHALALATEEEGGRAESAAALEGLRQTVAEVRSRRK